MEKEVPPPQKRMSDKARGGKGNTKRQETQANQKRSSAGRPQMAPSAATAEPPPPYQPPLHCINMPYFANQQMPPNTGYQMSPFALPQAIGQPLQITLQIQQPPGCFINTGVPAMFQPPPIGSVSYQSVPISAGVLQPQGGNNACQRPASAKVNNKGAKKSASDACGQAVSASAKNDATEVHSEKNFSSRGGQSQRGNRQPRGRGQQFARGRGGFTHEVVSAVHEKPASQKWRAPGNQSNDCVQNLYAGREQHHIVRGQHGGRGQRNIRGRGMGHHTSIVSVKNPPSVQSSIELGETSTAGRHFLRGRATRTPLVRRHAQSRDCMVPTVVSSNNCQENAYQRSFHRFPRGRGGQRWNRWQSNKHCSVPTNEVSKGQAFSFVEERSVSEVASDAGDWEDVETVSIADSEAGIAAEKDVTQPLGTGLCHTAVPPGHGMSMALFTGSAQAVHQHSYRGRGRRGRGRFNGRWIAGTSRCAYRVPQVINDKREEMGTDDAASITEQSEVSSVADSSEWVDENASELGDVEHPQNQRIKGCSTVKRGRGRAGTLASRKSTGHTKMAVYRAVSKSGESFESAAVDCCTESVVSCNIEMDNPVIQGQKLVEFSIPLKQSSERQMQLHSIPPNSEEFQSCTASQQMLAPETMKTEDVPQKLTRKQKQRQKQQLEGHHGQEQKFIAPLEDHEKLQNAGERAQIHQQGKKTQKQSEKPEHLQPNQLQLPDNGASSVASTDATDAGQNVLGKKHSKPQKKSDRKSVNVAVKVADQQSCGPSFDVHNISETDDVNAKCGNSAVVDADIKNEVAVASVKVDENTVLCFILNNFGAQCEIEHLYHLFGIDHFSDIKQLISSYRRIKVFENASNVNRSMVFVFLKGLRLCANLSRCQKGPNCPYLHMCPNFVAGGCLEPSCPQQRSHSFVDEHNIQVIKKYGIYAVCKDESVLLKLAQCSNPMVCRAHNETEGPCCAVPESCLKLHVCNEFLCGRCLIPNATCPYGHNLYAERNVSLLQLIELAHLITKDERLFRRMIVTNSNNSVNQSRSGNVHGRNEHSDGAAGPRKPVDAGEAKHKYSRKLPGVDFVGAVGPTAEGFLKDTGAISFFADDELVADAFSKSLTLEPSRVKAEPEKTSDRCDQYEKHKCGSNSECFERHSSEPYLWRLRSGEDWIPFDQQHEIEQAYSNPDVAVFRASIEMEQTEINFDTMSCHRGEVQRLSTPSFVVAPNKTDATRWCWYWREGNKVQKLWILYEDNKPPFRDILEAKYLYDKTFACCFEAPNHQQYRIDFVIMKQINMTTGFKRDVRRRPQFLSSCEIPPSFPLNFNPSKLPVNEGWVPMNTELDSWTDLVPLSENHREARHLYARVSSEFRRTIPSPDFIIKNIYRVQNLELWAKYQEHKNKMMKKHRESTELERQLFHGTDDETTVRCICNQNFDPRMHGTHGTVYGRGAYFATTSKYSHTYTQPIGSGGNRFMFLARVLVGRSTPGKPEYKRPPPLDSSRQHGALYDSCVDNVDNPTVFVVFDSRQCYPEFLIEYKFKQPQDQSAALQAQSISTSQQPTQAQTGSSPSGSIQQAQSSSATGNVQQSRSTSGSSMKQEGCSVM